ncbi:MAG: tRNA (adenosine(37)-N6)-threonylcarbamoyltransferase complex ATPase subunit type 1 TsaE [Bacteroidetes bacterium]|jgi:tRNA threonylcarbamoyladenosine biosynthesis protein TsaE|nr:tRNA (adenosine(37)-N6)-threonylcarbamoyltransferase complex ATPase subunit type 1 TsaE [Bacteroidota bacterium]MBX7238136.1 tRNA (adenosine(37)-N6)-threonylcarbamoyltransferase complex ATPase subunit type 1 TsaE [Bacteroidia bacterium]MCC7513587.1 tRNA (adenosine(37)-N6)-threonylcarbamoyltransferase complex ATPase subunit type 1 TsaE [Bacteroidia bacterium]MCW5918452.1 tRNA (adenosine(37)-N6)-threonylcarbamoyltransferase complex ATPase subunit type 1 TsaE [Bacteroidota bacterium]HMU77050.1 
MSEHVFFCNSPDELNSVAKQILAVIGESKIVLFKGEMGAGKTTLIKALCKQLNVADNVSSPTFSIVNEYHAANEVIYHFDFYRINNLREVYDMGYEEYFFGGHRCFIEWPEKIEGIINFDYTLVQVDAKDEIRTIIVTI